ncbi:MAG TPA: hypothetical protein ENH23_05370 [candidate division Zixibacteria bacterium]|nr:hypothetical protein [candidate division Zixibacteria bacterium]
MDDIIKPGDEWKYHYRGTRYHFNSEQEMWWQTFRDGLNVPVISGHEEILKSLLEIKPVGGSFRITETGDVLTKIINENDEPKWKAIYVCELDGTFKFDDGININQKGLQPGDLWLSFFDGARYSYLTSRIWWNNPKGFRQYTEQTLPADVIAGLRRYKPSGGSFRITENGFVITLIPKQPIPNNLKEQWKKLTPKQQRLIATKVDLVDMLPIYVGRYYEGFSLKDPVDYSKPLGKEEKALMLDFLDAFSIDTQFEGMVPKDINSDKLEESAKYLDDPEDWQ